MENELSLHNINPEPEAKVVELFPPKIDEEAVLREKSIHVVDGDFFFGRQFNYTLECMAFESKDDPDKGPIIKYGPIFSIGKATVEKFQEELWERQQEDQQDLRILTGNIGTIEDYIRPFQYYQELSTQK